MKRFLLVGLLFLLAAPLAAQSLKSPSQFLGYEMGQRFTYHHKAVAYVEHVAAVKDNVKLEVYGQTYEGRPLMVAFISSQENMNRLEQIRENNLRRVGLIEGTPVDDGITIVWLSHNIHGNESVSLEAALMTLWKLADPTNAETQEWLKNTVVVIDPTVNPDGRDRYSVWYHQTVGKNMNVNRDAREHYEPWPGGRANHYLFDLNRDWAWQSQQESQVRAKLYHKWYPHVHADFHEMGPDSPYYFAPAAAPYHEALTKFQREFQVQIGRNHARYFDKDFRLYYTREVFDLFYPSYGDTWPTYQGAIGMTYEQGGSGFAGLGVIISNGDTLTLTARISNQHNVGLSTVEVSAKNASAISREFTNYFATSRNSPAGTYKTYVIKDNGNPDNMRAFLDLLDNQQIRYGLAPARRSANGFDYTTGRNASFTMETTDIVVSLFQPKSVLANVLLEPRTTVVDSLTYDITAWSLPYAYNLKAYALTERINPNMNDVRKAFEYTAPAASASAPYAYVVEWKSLDDVRFLAHLQNNGVKVRSSEKAFTIGGKSYAPGTLVVARTSNEALGSRFDAIVREAAIAHKRVLNPVVTGMVDSGVDFGSGSVRFLHAPKVAVLAGDGVSSLAYGEVWHYFDQQIDYPVTSVWIQNFANMNLNAYDVLILPSGNYRSILSGSNLDKLTAWVRAGGKLIAMENVVNQLSSVDGFKALVQKEEADEPEGDDLLRVYGDQERESMRTSLAGAIYKVNIDATHPLGFGFPGVYYSMKRSDAAFNYLASGWNVGVIPADGFVSGFVGHELKPRLTETLVFGTMPMGRGTVVVMVDNPLFRAFWHSGKMIFGNAVFQAGN